MEKVSTSDVALRALNSSPLTMMAKVEAGWQEVFYCGLALF